MKHLLRASIDGVLERLSAGGVLPLAAIPDYQIETPKLAEHGDYSTNVAMLLAKPCARPPRDLAQLLITELDRLELLDRCAVAGPGFINFVISDRVLFESLGRAREAGGDYGRSLIGRGRRVQVEFVSANPTGPLHIGHGRGAAIGSALASLLVSCGYIVEREYYVNDAGRQMDILALSVWLRYLEAAGIALTFPAQAYRGGYIGDIAASLREIHGAALEVAGAELPAAAADGGERALDAFIERARALLGSSRFEAVRDLAKEAILEGIKTDLAAFGAHFDSWYSEASLTTSGAVGRALGKLRASGQVYEREGAHWFRSTAHGDEKDRVVLRENGMTTYFASDIAYHHEKFERGFDHVIDVWGADHHGYVPRVRAALAALGVQPERLEVVLVQFATLMRGGERVAMSTRAGEFVTLRELVDEVGVDAARYFYVMRRSDQHLEFDLDLAKAQSADNPVYYVQYAHARICSVFRQLRERKLERGAPRRPLSELLCVPAERSIAMRVAAFPEALEAAALAREPHQLTNYLRTLATEFHGYYNAHKVLVDDVDVRDARLDLLAAVRQVIANALGILGICAPEEM